MQLTETRYTTYLGQDKRDKAMAYIKDKLARIDMIPEDFQEDYERRLTAKLYPI
jgi:hypothetical protein